MNCPIDGTQLQMTDRQGVEIDYCPKCRGVWLDRGELDKFIHAFEDDEPHRARGRRDRDDDYDYDDDDDDDHGGFGGRRRGFGGRENDRGGFLENFFDFGGD